MKHLFRVPAFLKKWKKTFTEQFKKYFRDRDEYLEVHYRYKQVLKSLNKKRRQGQKIRVCFSVVYDSVFPAAPVFEQMLKEDVFSPFILVIPDAVRGEENMFHHLKKNYK